MVSFDHHRVSSQAGLYTLYFSLFIIYAWWSDIAYFVADADSMKISTALSFAVLSLPLIFGTKEKRSNLDLMVNAVILLISFSSISVYYLPKSIIPTETSIFSNPFYTLMSPGTATCFILISFSQLIKRWNFNRNLIVSQWILHLVTLIATMSILFHLLNIGVDQKSPFFATMSIFTSIILFVHSITYSYMHPEIGVTGLLFGKSLGSKLAQSSFPSIFVVFFLVTAVALNTYYKGVVSPEVILISTSTVFLFIALASTAKLSFRLNQLDKKNKAFEATIQATNTTLEERIKDSIKDLTIQNHKLETYNKALETSSLVSITDIKGNIIEVNEKFCKVFKYDRSELIGKNHRIINSGYHNGAFWHNLWKTIFNGEVWRGEIRNKAKDGSYYWVDTVICPMHDENGKLSQFLSVRQDITNTRRALLELDATTEILNEAQALGKLGGWQLDVQTGQTVWTEEVYNIHEVETDFDHNRVNGIDFYHPDYRAVITEAITEAIENHIEFDVECKFITAKQNERWVRVSGKPMFEHGEVAQLIGVFQDITEEVQIKKELEEAKSFAMEASKAKSSFIANMSHEIRTPLNGIIGFTDLLLKSKLNPSQLEHMQLVKKSGQCLLDVINDILDFSKIEAGKLDLNIDHTDFFSLIEGVTSVLSFETKNKNIELIVDINPAELPASIWIDEIRLRQVLINLLSNALKFTENGEIELSISEIQSGKGKSTFRFSVRDTGIGISNSVKSKIFGAFDQADYATTRKYGGTGLGLSISRSILNLMGSELHLQSQLGEGSTFYFDLTTNVSEEKMFDDHPTLKFKTALIADQNDHSAHILSDQLDLFDIKSTIVAGGEEALKLLDNNKSFDIIFVNYDMPVLNGLETVDIMRQYPNIQANKTPIIICHNMIKCDFANTIKKHDISDKLAKPILIEKLSNCLISLNSKEQKNESKKTKEKDLQVQFDNNLTLLIAEDNPVNMSLSVTILNRILPNAKIIEAVDGLDAINAFNKEDVDMVITDIQMPELNGYDLVKAIRRADKEVPVFGLTAGTVNGERQRCLKVGMNDMLTKPLIEEQIIEMITNWFDFKKNAVRKTAMVENNQTDQNEDEHFDEAKLYEVLQSQDKLDKLIGMAIKNLITANSEFEIALKKKDMNLLRTTAHKICGMSKSIFLTKLKDQTEQLQYLGDEDIEKARALVAETKTEIKLLMSQIFKPYKKGA